MNSCFLASSESRSGRAPDLEAPDVVVEGSGEPLEVDRFLVGRALSNLVSNARKYARETPITITVEGSTVRVRDRGPGVPEAELTFTAWG